MSLRGRKVITFLPRTYFDSIDKNMASELAQIEFYFPKDGKKAMGKRELADLIIEEMKKNGSIDYSGFADEKRLRDGIESHLGDVASLGYETLSGEQKQQAEHAIRKTIEKCNEILPIPVKNYVFVFPWFPTEEFRMFGGSLGVAPYSCVFHIFLSPRTWSHEALTNTVAHELNHTIFYYHHYDKFNNYDLLDNLIMEGLAENFREQVADLNPSPWSSALTEEEAFALLASLKDKLDSRDANFSQELFFGSNEYRRWSGYSIGYWVVKKFIRLNEGLSWGEIMKKDSREILDEAIKK